MPGQAQQASYQAYATAAVALDYISTHQLRVAITFGRLRGHSRRECSCHGRKDRQPHYALRHVLNDNVGNECAFAGYADLY